MLLHDIIVSCHRPCVCFTKHFLIPAGAPSTTNLYLFNGDIVDKGPKSTECMILLFLLKLQYPNYVFINRGNHECSLINATLV